MKINQLKSGVIISYLTQIIQILTGVLYTPVMLRLLGQSEYGLYQLVGSVVSYLSLLSMGFNAGYVRFYSAYKAKKDETGIAKLNAMFVIIFAVSSLLCILSGIVLAFNAEIVFGNGLSAYELYKARILLAVMVLNMAISLMDSVFKCYITANEQFFPLQAATLIKSLFSPVVTLPLLIMGHGSVAVVAISCVLTFGVFLWDVFYSISKLKMTFSFRKPEAGLFKEIWVFTIFVFMGMLVDQLNWNVDKILLGRMIGTTAVAIYGVAGQLNALYMNFSSVVSGVFVPRVNMLVVENQGDKNLTSLFTRVGRIQFIILGLIISGYVVFGKEFVKLWAGKGYEASYYIGLFLMLPATVPLIQSLGIEIQKAKNKHWVRSVVYLIISISNILISIPFIKMWGERGAAVGTAVSLLVGNGFFMNVYYHRSIKLNIIYFWREIAKCFPAFLIALIFGLGMKEIIVPDKVVYLIAEIMIYCCIYAVFMWYIGMNESEKDILRKPLKLRR